MIRIFRILILFLGAAVMSAASSGAFAQAGPFGTSVEMHQHSSGNVYVTGYFNGDIATEFLVDTGSGYVTISTSTYRKISKKVDTQYLRTIRGALANDKVIKLAIYRVAHLSIGSQCDLFDVEVAVMPGESVNILGINALQQKQPFALQFDPPQLLLSNCGSLSPPQATAALSAR